MITLRPICESANLYLSKSAQPTLRHKAVVDVEWRGLFPPEKMSGTRLLAWILAREMMIGAD